MTTPEQEPVEPYDIGAESALVGSLLINGSSLPTVMSVVVPTDFYGARYQYCYEACLSLFERQARIDYVTVGQELQRRERLEAVGGTDFLSGLMASTPSSLGISYYAGIVADLAARRRIMDAGRRIYEIGQTDRSEISQTFSNSLDQLFLAQPNTRTRDFVSLNESFDLYLQGMTDDSDPNAEYHQSGYPDLDYILKGIQSTDLLILGARPSVGKSSLALNMAINIAQQNATCAIFSLEMSVDQVAQRILASHSGVDASRIRLGLFSEQEESVILNSIGYLSSLPVYIDDTPNQPINDVRSKAQRLQMERGLDFVVVDYLQLMRTTGSRSGMGNRVQEISEISRGLKAMARDLRVPVLTCSQLNREVENRPNHRPQLSDLRDSGSIEQDADVVLFLHRDDRYVTEDEWERSYPGHPYPKNLAEVIVSKHRNGATGSAWMYFQESVMRFDNFQRVSP